MVRARRLIGAAFAALMLVGCSEPVAEHAGNPDSLWTIERWKAEGTSAVLIDVSRDAAYAEGHLPGAHQLWRTDIESTEYPYSGMAASRAQLSFLMDSLGVAPGQQVVIYDGVGGCDAARLWWLLRLYGHPQVALLDGGARAWTLGGDALSVVTPVPGAPVGFEFVGEPDASLLANVEDVRNAAAQGVVLLDTRTDDEYTGRRMKSGAVRAGRIPQSLHYNWGNAVDLTGSGCMKSVADLKWDLTSAGVQPDAQIITYCHTGVRSAHTTFVLRELLGYEHVSNYDGSWTQWSHFEELPIVADQPVNPAL